MTTPLEKFKMQTNFEGLIQLLAKHLYPEPDVFVRELVQNAHDSIQRRREVDSSLEGRIDVSVCYDDATITFQDNGIGMDKQDIKDFLAVIGSTGTGTARKQLQAAGKEIAYELIGQFGIGMLSAFVVAEKVVVRTRKLGESEAFAWHNSGSTDCELYADDLSVTGTQIIIYINQDYAFILDEKRLKEALIKYCDLIRFPIFFNDKGPINTIDAPWHRKHWTSQSEKEASYGVFLKHRYPDIPLDVIPIEINEPFHAYGALYISDRHVPDVNTTGVVDIFVRRMFIRANDNAFLPPWAKFVRGIIDSPDLQPTAARDNIQRQDDAFQFLQKRLGELIVERLIYLARHDNSKFRQINMWHHYHLKGMAYYHDDFFEQVVEMLIFETNRGQMSLKEYLTQNKPRPDKGNKSLIYYFSHNEAAPQFYQLADAREWVVINAGYIFDEELIKKYAEKNDMSVHLERFDATDDPELFQRLEHYEEDHYRQLELDVEGYLRREDIHNVAVRMRRFAPAELPAVVIVTQETEAERKLEDLVSQPWFMEGLEDVSREALEQSKRRPIYLSLNVDNPLIQKLAESDRRNSSVKEVMGGLYHSAMLYSHNLLTHRNSNMIHRQYISVLNQIMQQRGEIMEVNRTLIQERSQVMEMKAQQTEMTAEKSDHIILFVMTPDHEKYKPLQIALRQIFEQQPYYFEVRVNQDYEKLKTNHKNIRQAHAYFVEITALDAMVMLELGSVSILSGQRPVFLLSQKDTPPLEVDLENKASIVYNTLTDTIENVEKTIRASFVDTDRPPYENLQQLLKIRKKRYLSQLLLSNLRTRLDANEIENIMNYYHTMEDLLKANAKDAELLTGLEDFMIKAIQGELEKMG